MKKEAFSVKRRRMEMKQDRNESDERRGWGEERRTGAARGMMVTFPLLRRNNQHQLRAHIKRQPRPQREESRGVWRSEQVGWGRESSWSRLCSSMLIRHKGIGLMSHKGIDSMTLFTGSEGASHAAEGTQHTARLKPTVSWYYTLYVKILHWFT